ncbi:MAG: AAA family ATPase [Ilumatobacteraceae bacterium]
MRGKTLIAKAVANSLAKKVAWAKTGDEKGRSYFINIKGPGAAEQAVGETERQIRLVFQRTREERGGLAGHRLRRDGLDVPHSRVGHLLGHGIHDRALAVVERSTAEGLRNIP